MTLSNLSSQQMPRVVGILPATSLVVANIIGVGIFTTSGFLARDLGSPGLLLGVWVLGGLIALSGALCYAELGAAFPQAGGEYVYLREAYGPLWGFLSGWMSFFIGFSAPIAAAAMGAAAYTRPLLPPAWEHLLPGWSERAAATGIILILSAIHAWGLRAGSIFQTAITVVKVGAIASLLALAFAVGRGDWSHLHGPWLSKPAPELVASLAVSLIFVLYAYSGWNAAAYIAGEIRQPEKNLLRSLAGGTLVVMALYLGLNAAYLYALSVDDMRGVLTVGEKAARASFGSAASPYVSALLALSILACTSAMIWAGPRVYFAMARDGLFPPAFGQVHSRFRTPVYSIFLQALWSVALVWTGTFEAILVYAGFPLVAFSLMAVASLVVLRIRRPGLARPYRVPGYPWVPLLFALATTWILFYTARGRPRESLYGLGTVLAGVPVYLFYARRKARRAS
ncbi:MAG: amino acid permease [Acidobacteria bacterium]|nr:amino acid permease [Acidobacteriota bacterium]